MSNALTNNWIRLDAQSVTPKYLQLTNSLLQAVESGKLQKGDLLPSINELSFELDISRDTAEKAYRHLKQLGVIGSVPGKGYFIATTDFRRHIKVLLIFNKLSAHKKIIYDALVSTLGESAAIDFYIYNNDFAQFRRILEKRQTDYTHYVIIPHFLEGGEQATALVNALPPGQLILLDKLIPGITRPYGAVYEDFEKDIYGVLEAARNQLSKYETLKMIFPDYTYHPREILNGFIHFCREYAFNYSVVSDIQQEPVTKGDVLISLMENDLVTCIEKIMAGSLNVGQDVGVISYNETPIKKFILEGITTISTDFQAMGSLTAAMILDNTVEKKAVPFHLTLRHSL